MKKINFFSKNLFLYCGLEKDEFNNIFPMIMERNVKLVSKCNIGVFLLGIVFIIVNSFVRSDNLLAYWILVAGGLGLCAFRILKKEIKGVSAYIFCYAMIIVVLAFGMMLSLEPGNAEMPSTSFVVFLVLLPVVVNDKPYRMGLVILFSSVVY